jgi:uncharacterized membrane protein
MSLDRDIEYYQRKQKRIQYQAGGGAVVAAVVLILVFSQDWHWFFLSAGLWVGATTIVYVWYTLTMWAKTYQKLLELRGKDKR